MSVDTHRVLMGTCGWKHPDWLNDFYSEDLPEDWQLGFYSNEFPVVYVPAAEGLDVLAEDDFSEWCEDVDDSFRFILEVSAATLANDDDFESAIEKIKALDELCLGLVFQLNPNICNDSKRVKQRIEKAQTVSAVCIDKANNQLSDDMNAVLVQLAVSEVWDGESESFENLNQASLAVCRVAANEMEMPVLKKVVEACLSISTEECTSVLCIDGQPPSLEVLRNANIILNLL